MARRKLMTLNEIKKHRRAIMRGLSALSNELDELASEANYDKDEEEWNQSQTDEADFIEDMVYGENGADDTISELMTLLTLNRVEVKEMRRGGGGGSL